MADVFRARHAVTELRVALKVLRDRTGEEDHARFLREIRALGALDHPNVVAIHDAGLHEGSPYYVMSLLPGKSFSDFLRNGRRLSPRDAAATAVLVCRGVGAAHAIGVIHRDIKPSNVFACSEPIPPHESVKLIDFGVCRPTEHLDLTRTGTIVGTPTYMSPEQVLGWKDVDARTDIYSIGAFLYRMLSGKLPIEAGSKGEAFIQIGSGNIVPIEARFPEVKPELGAIVHRALAFRRDDRYQEVSALRAALEPFAIGSRLVRVPSGVMARPFLPIEPDE